MKLAAQKTTPHDALGPPRRSPSARLTPRRLITASALCDI